MSVYLVPVMEIITHLSFNCMQKVLYICTRKVLILYFTVELDINGLVPQNTTVASYFPENYTCNPQNSKIQLLESGDLLTDVLQANDSGIYKCVLGSNDGIIIFNLTVQRKFILHIFFII